MDERRLLPTPGALPAALRVARGGPVQSLIKRKIGALRAQLDAAGDPAGRLPLVLAMASVLYDVMTAHSRFARERLRPNVRDLRAQWTLALQAHAQQLRTRETPANDELYAELVDHFLFRMRGEYHGTSHMVCQTWIVEDMTACANRNCTPFAGPGVRWCYAHGAVGAATLLRALTRTLEFALDWHEHALYEHLTAADENRLYQARRLELYHNMDLLLLEDDRREAQWGTDLQRRAQHCIGATSCFWKWFLFC